MWRQMLVDRLLYQRLPHQTSQSDLKSSVVEEYNVYVQYYSTDRSSSLLPYQFGKFRYFASVFFTILLLLFVVSTWQKGTKTLGGELNCDPEVMQPSPFIPKNVNKVRPADLKVIAAMGDSITVATLSKDFEDDKSRNVYPGNSYIIGGDGSLSDQITVGKVLREFNPNLVGLSHGSGYNNTVFNVAVGGVTSEDMPRQARELIERMKQKGVSLAEDWKIVTIFIGTNDIAKLRCFSKKEPITREAYKANLVEAISILRGNLNRTIVSIVSIWNSHLVFNAQSLIKTGKRMDCGDHFMEKRDLLCNEYRKVAYEIQDGKQFDNEDFTVVVQGFMDNIRDAFRNKDGIYDKSFYAEDMFHLSKYGNAVMGKFLWNSILEPVGRKSDGVNFEHDYIPLKCPTKERPYVQTLGNK